MANFEFSLNNDIALEAENTGGSFGVLDTGVYSITIKHAAMNKTKNGNNVVDISIQTEDGHETTIWGMCIDPTWASGSENYDYKKWQSLAAVTGMKTGETAPYKLELSNGQVKDLVVFKELQGAKLKVALQKELSVYQGDVKEKNIFHSFYFEDGCTLSERMSKKTAERIDKVAARLTDKHDKSYKNQGNATTATAVVEESTPDIFGS